MKLSIGLLVAIIILVGLKFTYQQGIQRGCQKTVMALMIEQYGTPPPQVLPQIEEGISKLCREAIK